MGFFGNRPTHRGVRVASPAMRKIEAEFDALAKRDEIEIKNIRAILSKLKYLATYFHTEQSNGSPFTAEQLKQEFYYALPDILRHLVELDRVLKQEVKFCFSCGENVKRGAVACPACGADLKPTYP